MRAADQRAFRKAITTPHARWPATRWLTSAYSQLRHLLPQRGVDTLLTDELTREGESIDVYAHFGIDPQVLHTVLFNLIGLMDSARVTESDRATPDEPPHWRGFRDIWVPINPELHLAGRLGLAEDDGVPRVADCIVLIPGLLGDNSLWRTRDIAHALRDNGLHVLALELRGYGQTERRYSDASYCYGVQEVGDLLAVSEWLQAHSYVRETGLIGFSWGANEALLVAWEDGRADDDPFVAPLMQAQQRPRSGRRHYRAGVIAFSPVIGFEELVAKLEQQWSMLSDPVLNRMQAGVRARFARESGGPGTGDLGKLVDYEIKQAGFTYSNAIDDAFQYLRLVASPGQPPIRKLDRARIPVLIVQAANDPLGSAQRVADLFAATSNPNVAGIILPGGGHNGFVSYNRPFFYSLILHFFHAQQADGDVAISVP